MDNPSHIAFKKIWNQNPTLGDLNLEGLSKEEKERILDVVKKEQDFTYKEGTTIKRGNTMEGQLCKFTNLVKGWQFRWFLLDAEAGSLTYYLDKEKSRSRGILYLGGAVISPSEEDSMTFTVHASSGDIYKLRGNDAKDRQHWINLIRAVSEYHTISTDAPATSTSQPNLAKEKQSSFKRAHTIGGVKRHGKSPLISKSTNQQNQQSSQRHGTGNRTPQTTHVKLGTNPIQDELKNIKDALTSVTEFHSSANEAFEISPQNGEVLATLDEQVLLLKATSQATVNILQQCHAILQQQAVDVQGSAHTTGLPAGATIEWLEPNCRFERSSSVESGSSVESAVDEMPPDQALYYHSLSQYEKDEVEDSGTRATEEKQEDMESHKSVILHLLSQMKLGMDLTRVVLPTFVLEKRSLLEMYADFFGHSDFFVRIPEGGSPEERMIRVLEFYLTSFHIGRKTSVAKKPYNPILGEHFHCSFIPNRDIKTNGESSNNDTVNKDTVNFVAEQVSHHPPISAFYAECPSKRISMNSHIWTKSKFYGMSIGVINIGEGVIYLPEHNEEYVITFPNAYCRSILTFPWIELGGRTFIKCQKTGYNATTTFHTKPFYGGITNRVTCELKGPDEQVVCRGEGSWDGTIELSFINGRVEKAILDVTALPLTPKRVRPLDAQSEYESRKLWKHVTEALSQGNLEKATEEKHKLEECQRNEVKQREAAGIEWKTILFHKHCDSWYINPHLTHVERRKKTRSITTPS